LEVVDRSIRFDTASSLRVAESRSTTRAENRRGRAVPILALDSRLDRPSVQLFYRRTRRALQRRAIARSNFGHISIVNPQGSTLAARDDRETLVSFHQAISALSEKLKIFATIRNEGDVDPTNDVAFAIASESGTSIRTETHFSLCFVFA
jgi:hypothetical protein